MRQSDEPSVDEILNSIKRVIARDNRTSSTEQRRMRETQGVPGAAPHSASRVQPDHHGHSEDDVLDLAVSAQFLDPIDDYSRENETCATGEREEMEEAPLVHPDARASMRESLAALAMMAQPGVAPQIVRSGETSLEGLVSELLKPALAEWLDAHLPAMVEEMVAAEISRIVGKR